MRGHTHFRVLGSLEVVREGRLVPLNAAKQRTILANLVLNGGLTVTVESLIDRVWGGEPPREARRALHVHVARLRRALGDGGRIQTSPEGYRLDLDGGSADIVAFEDLYRRARLAVHRADPRAALAALRRAVTLWRWPVLANVPSAALHTEVVPSLVESYLQASEERFRLEIALGNHRDVVAELLTESARHPLRERIKGQLMSALHLSGRQAEALDVYRTHVRSLRADLGLDPGEELTAVHQSVLTGQLHAVTPVATRGHAHASMAAGA